MDGEAAPPPNDVGIDPVSLPTILALPLAELAHEVRPQLAIWQVCEVAEMLLRFVVIAGIAEHSTANKGRLPAKLREQLAHGIEMPTMGRWLAAAVGLTRQLPDTAVIRELAGLADQLEEWLGTGTETSERCLLPVRNRIAHGGGVAEHLAARLLALHLPRLRATMQEARWLTELELQAPNSERGTVRLRGPAWRATALPAAGGIHGEEAVVLRRGARSLALWPLNQFRRSNAFADAPALQVYSRRSKDQLYFTPFDDAFESTAAPDAVAAFKALFDPPEGTPAKASGFELELRRDSDELVGRDAQLRVILEEIAASAGGVLWLTGSPGIGKSMVVARVATELWDSPDAQLAIAYRFRIGDARTSREAFLRFAIEQLERRGPASERAPARSLEARLWELLAESAHKVVFVVDGLDEATERDPSFIEDVVVRGALPNVVWLCAGRPLAHLERAFQRAGCRKIFPDGMPRMADADIRAQLVDKLGKAARRLVALDASRPDGTVSNAFIDKIVARAGGLPLYVRYLIGDLLGGKLAISTAEQRLPPSLDAYHQRLLEEAAVGDLHLVATPMFATLALVQEPLSEAEIVELLAARSLLLLDDASRELVARALATARHLIRSTDDERVELFHASVASHILTSTAMRMTVRTTEKSLCDLAMQWRTAQGIRPVLVRQGVRLLLASGRVAEAKALVTDLEYLLARIEHGTLDSLARELATLARQLPGDAAIGALVRFFATHRHQLVDDPARMLVQLALAEAGDFPLGAAADRLYGERRWPHLLRSVARGQVSESRLVSVFDSGDTRVISIAVGMASSAVAAATDADRIVVWDIESGTSLASLVVPQQPTAVALHPSEPLVAYSALDDSVAVVRLDDRSTVLRLTDPEEEAAKAELEARAERFRERVRGMLEKVNRGERTQLVQFVEIARELVDACGPKYRQLFSRSERLRVDHDSLDELLHQALRANPDRSLGSVGRGIVADRRAKEHAEGRRPYVTVAFDGERLVIGRASEVQRVDLRTQHVEGTPRREAHSPPCRLDDAGRHVYCSDRTLIVEEPSFERHIAIPAEATCLARVSNNRVAVGLDDGTVRIYDAS